MNDSEFWTDYAKRNDSDEISEFAKFIRDLANSLHCSSILEVGCCTGNDLLGFSDQDVCGIDINEYAIRRSREKLPKFDFKIADSAKIPFGDSSIDFVFTHRLLNYLDNKNADLTISELFRVSKRYIVNCEIGYQPENWVEPILTKNIFEKWLDYKVKIISNVEMHEEIEPQKARFVLVKKMH